MGKLVHGRWLTDDELAAAEASQYAEAKGRFQRGDAKFRNWLTVSGEPGPSGDGGFPAEAGRYHLFAAINCPWAHRTLIYRVIKQLQPLISLSFVAPLRTDRGWVFDRGEQRFVDDLYDSSALYEIYLRAEPEFTGRVTVPVLWDKQRETIVSTESAEIIRMFNSAFDQITGDEQNFYPDDLADEIDELNDFVYSNLNNGVYRTGFARTQEAYNEGVAQVFMALDTLEEQLSGQRYLLGDQVTEADWRLFPTLMRFDVGYYSAFKCNVRPLRDYPNLFAYAKSLYAYPGVAETVDFDVYRRGYHSRSPHRNPHGIVPIGPDRSLLPIANE